MFKEFEIEYKASTIMEMFKEFLEKEYKDLVSVMRVHPEDTTTARNATIDQAMARCCGVAFFMQNFADFEDVNKLYHEYWNKFWELKRQ